jgi:hypothetical protein
VTSEIVTTAPGDREQPEEPTERAILQIRTSPPSIKVSVEGAAAWSLALGVVGCAATIAVGHFVGFPVWAVIVVCALQIAGAVARRRG